MTSTLLIALITIVFQIPQTHFDPLKTTEKVTIVDAEFTYGNDDRKVPLRIYLPESKSAAPVILFSHGLGGSRENNPYLGNHWAGRGYIVVFMQHDGSDANIWKDVDRRDRLKRMKAAASKESFTGRTSDVPATLDQLKKWNAKGKKFAGRLNLKKVGMSGHSFGAITTQALSGQNYGRLGQTHTDSRIAAAIAMSPSPPQIGNNQDTFEKVKIPWLLMTGTKDKSIVARTKPEERRKVFQQLPDGEHFYELVLHNAEHMAFSERKLSGGTQRNKNHHKAILGLSSAFWDAYLKDDDGAKKWLKGDKAKNILEPKDIWQMK